MSGFMEVILDDLTAKRLSVMAAEQGVSPEEYARQLLGRRFSSICGAQKDSRPRLKRVK